MNLALISLLVLLSMILAACPSAAPAPSAEAPAEAATEAPAAEAAPAEAAAPAPGMEGRVQIRWFVGLGTGSGEDQIPAEDEVIKKFNESQDKIELVAEYVPNASARDTLATQIASGNGPDIVGPVGWGGSNAFAGQYLDLSALIESTGYDTSNVNQALIKMYQSESGAQVGLPFLVFPAAMFYQKEAFDEAGLNYPPAAYGEKYKMADGSEVEWNYDTMSQIAKILTVDSNGNDATSPGFDAAKIVQYGFTYQWQTHPNYIGTYYGGAASLAGADGKTATVPETWVAGWKWWHEAMWGAQAFAPTGPVIQSPEFGGGNAFSSGKVAMAISPSWYTCCIGDAGENWDLAALPADASGQVNGRIDADTFRILKGTAHPEDAFTVLQYLLNDAGVSLATVYGGMPARPDQAEEWFKSKQTQFPFVSNWQVVTDGLAYPDVPSAEAATPNWSEAWDRVLQVESLLLNEKEVDIDGQAATLQTDLQAIFDKAEN